MGEGEGVDKIPKSIGYDERLTCNNAGNWPQSQHWRWSGGGGPSSAEDKCRLDKKRDGIPNRYRTTTTNSNESNGST